MRKKFLVGLAAISATFIIAHGAAAEPARTGAVSLSPHLGWFWAEGSEPYDAHSLDWGVGVGYSFNEVLGLEFTFDKMDPDRKRGDGGDGDEDIHMFKLDGLYHWRPGKKLEPYVGAGLGFADYEHQDTRFLVDGGGGLEYFIMDNLSLRADSRYIFTFNHSVSNLLTTFGVTYYFGGPTHARKTAAIAPPAYAAPRKEAVAKAPTQVKGVTCFNLKVHFAFNKADIKPEYDSELKRVADFLQANPDAHATVQAYADAVGSKEYNLKLTDRRAQAVKNYLVKHFNISADRLETEGMGKSNPIATNLTNTGRAENRRAVRVFCSNGKEMAETKPKKVCVGLKVMFDSGSAKFKSEYEPEVKRVAEYMKEHPEMNGTIEGYADNTGPDRFNKKLSLNRAEAVKDRLVKDYGISSDRLKTEGFGESRPIANNSTPEGRAQNRYAVEIICTPAK
ncbi:MAG: OmpA family protein [Nitrospirota bacterium]